MCQFNYLIMNMQFNLFSQIKLQCKQASKQKFGGASEKTTGFKK